MYDLNFFRRFQFEIHTRFSALDKSSSSTPIDAVRNIISRLLSERDLQLATPKPSNRSRGSRLENKFGLNITEDAFVEMKLKQRQKKPTPRRKIHLQKDKAITSKSYAETKRRRKTAALSKYIDGEDEDLKDSEVAAAVNNLENVLEYTQLQFDDDISCSIFDILE